MDANLFLQCCNATDIIHEKPGEGRSDPPGGRGLTLTIFLYYATFARGGGGLVRPTLAFRN